MCVNNAIFYMGAADLALLEKDPEVEKVDGGLSLYGILLLPLENSLDIVEKV